jgi:hypothetical protein
MLQGGLNLMPVHPAHYMDRACTGNIAPCVCVHACVLLQLLDEGSPFLELSPLAGKELYGE